LKFISHTHTLAVGIPCDGNYKGRLHMTYYGPFSDVHTSV